MKQLTFIDLFAGAGGLSEGFIRAGFKPIAHIEMDKNACDTIRTRTAFHHLANAKKSDAYYQYLNGNLDRESLWSEVPANQMNLVMQ